MFLARHNRESNTSETGFLDKNNKNNISGLGLPIIGAEQGGRGGGGAVAPPPKTRISGGLRGSAPPPPCTFRRRSLALELLDQQLHIVHNAVNAARSVSGNKYKNHLQSSRQNSCPQNATRKCLQTVKIVFCITYGIADFQAHIFYPTKTKKLP